MSKFIPFSFFLYFCCLTTLNGLSISRENAQKIGEKIWANECNKSVEGLTCWNKGENFASLGIGHFIWYSSAQHERFEETFPALLTFLKQEGVSLPPWLQPSTACPWNSREEFYKNIQSAEMKRLRQLLFDTRNLQALFIAKRLEASFTAILEKSPFREKDKINDLFHRLLKETNGLYALIDYVHFKGSGISPHERYNGQGWGLLQVLQAMPETSEDIVYDFAKTAKNILKQRVINSPPERNEARWLKGWFNRIDTYLALGGDN